MIQYADIVYDTIVDGIGLRNTLYVSGCSHNCPGCHNKPLQDYNYGKQATWRELYNLLTINDNDITISGGEPFDQSSKLFNLVVEIRQNYPERNIWIYSGYTYEELMNGFFLHKF